MEDTGCFKSKESQELFGQLSVLSVTDQPIEELKLLADRFLQLEGEVPHENVCLTIFVATYFEYGMEYNDKNSIRKASRCTQLGYDLYVENDPAKSWYFDKYLGISIFHGESLGIEELEKIEFHLGRYCELDSSDQHANGVLMMARKMKHEIMRKDLRR